ncbi:MAG: ribonuclease P protein component [Defluviitaleaceae bacterium]|nr:ribonuclease P protein component [Defluviitaleaceae bacterium]
MLRARLESTESTKLQTIKKNYQFSKVYNRGKSFANKHLVLYLLPNKESCNFFGISISKKLGKSVKRNRIRRIIKECLRIKNLTIKQGYSIVVIVRINAQGISYKEIEKSLDNLLKKHGILL